MNEARLAAAAAAADDIKIEFKGTLLPQSLYDVNQATPT
jgi:hypothetical protein